MLKLSNKDVLLSWMTSLNANVDLTVPNSYVMTTYNFKFKINENTELVLYDKTSEITRFWPLQNENKKLDPELSVQHKHTENTM